MPQPPIRFDDGAAYERWMGVWSRSVGKVFLNFLSPPPGLRWLDVGCGNGAFTQLVAHSCAPGAIHGIDPSEGQLAYARDRLAGENATFRQGDAQALPFQDASFDIAVMALVIHFVPDPARAVAEMARVARPDGTVASYTWAYDQALSPIDPFDAEFATAGIPAPRPPHPGCRILAGIARPLDQCRPGRDRDTDHPRGTELRKFRRSIGSDYRNRPPQGGGGGNGCLGPRRVQARLRPRFPADAGGRITYAAQANAIKGRVPA